MSDQPEKKQTLEEAAAEAAAESLQVVEITVANESELDDYEFYEDVEDIAETLKIPIQVLSFDNPSDPEKKINYAIRQIQPDEYAEIFGTMFDVNMLQDVLSEAMETETDTDKLKENITENVSEKVVKENIPEKQRQRIIAAVTRCIVRPKKKSIKSTEKLPKDMVNALFQSCTKQMDRVWRFQSMADSTAGQSGRTST